MPTDRAMITYRVAGTTRHKTIRGGHVSAQMGPDCTIVDVSTHRGATPTRTILFAAADYIDLHRGGDDG